MRIPGKQISMIYGNEQISERIRKDGIRFYIFLYMSTLTYRFEKLRLLLEGVEGVIPLGRIQHLIYVSESCPFQPSLHLGLQCAQGPARRRG